MYCVCGIILQEYEFELACFPESDCLHQKLLTDAMQSRKKKGSSACELGCGNFPWSVELLYCLKCIYTHTHTCDICLVAVFPAAAV